MSAGAEVSAEKGPKAPRLQGLDLFEHYEHTGSLLVVTSDASTLRLEPGDFIVRRAWATAAEPHEHNRARAPRSGGSGQ